MSALSCHKAKSFLVSILSLLYLSTCLSFYTCCQRSSISVVRVSERFTVRLPQSFLGAKMLNFSSSTRITLIQCWQPFLFIFFLFFSPLHFNITCNCSYNSCYNSNIGKVFCCHYINDK